MIKDSLINLTKYNVWANTRLIGFILEAGEEKVDIIQKSSFSSIRKTLYHIWDAEYIWINRLLGKSFTSGESKDFSGSLGEACNLLLNHSKHFVSFVENKTEEELNVQLSYKNIEGKEFSNTASQIIMHVMNHSTFHRGQLITLLRNVGYEKFSSTDYIAFCRI